MASREPKAKPFLSQIEGFRAGLLQHVDTHLTTSEGKKFIEKRDASGATTLEQQEHTGLGFCPDLTPDKTVGIATERLLVGSQDMAHDYLKLTELGVTHILNVGYGIPNAFTNDFQYLTVEMVDDFSETLMTHYPQCERFIDEAREKGVVLIHCNAGVSRSASIALAYVMHKEKVPLDTALERLRSTRPAVRPNDEFMKQLRALEVSLGNQQKQTTTLV